MERRQRKEIDKRLQEMHIFPLNKEAIFTADSQTCNSMKITENMSNGGLPLPQLHGSGVLLGQSN